MRKNNILLILPLLLFSCRNEQPATAKAKETISPSGNMDKLLAGENPLNDTIVKSKKHSFKDLFCDMDGDKLKDTVQIVQNTNNKKYGLKISYGNYRVDYLGMGKEVIGQGFDEVGWIGVFEKVAKGTMCSSNVDETGEFLLEEVKDEDKIKLPNDGIFIHQAESCGGGIIYRDGNRFAWIQQE